MIGRLYKSRSGARTVANADGAHGLIEVGAPSDAVVVIHRWQIFQTSDTGDAEEEIIALEELIGDTSGSGGLSGTVESVPRGGVAFGGTVEFENTTRVTTTIDNYTDHGWNVRGPYDCVYGPEERPIISPGDFWEIGIAAGPADDLVCHMSVVFAEIGG